MCAIEIIVIPKYCCKDQKRLILKLYFTAIVSKTLRSIHSSELRVRVNKDSDYHGSDEKKGVSSVGWSPPDPTTTTPPPHVENVVGIVTSEVNVCDDIVSSLGR